MRNYAADLEIAHEKIWTTMFRNRRDATLGAAPNAYHLCDVFDHLFRLDVRENGVGNLTGIVEISATEIGEVFGCDNGAMFPLYMLEKLAKHNIVTEIRNDNPGGMFDRKLTLKLNPVSEWLSHDEANGKLIREHMEWNRENG